jgi:hypothetical protein
MDRRGAAEILLKLCNARASRFQWRCRKHIVVLEVLSAEEGVACARPADAATQ